MSLSIEWGSIESLHKFHSKIIALDVKFPKVMPRIINQVGDKTKTAVIRSLTKQTGLKRATIVRAIGAPKRAYPGNLTYTMVTKGGDISVKHFGAKEFFGGVSAKPKGQSTQYAGAFIKGGAFPNRVNAKRLNGHAFTRQGSKLSKVKSGVYIPHEMVTGDTADTFNRVVATELPKKILQALAKLT